MRYQNANASSGNSDIADEGLPQSHAAFFITSKRKIKWVDPFELKQDLCHQGQSK